MLTFAFRGTIEDVDSTVEGESHHPATVLIIEAAETLSRVVVPDAVLQERLPLLCVGRPVAISGVVHDVFSQSGLTHIARELRLLAPIH
jgi:hypothetical protein